VKVFEREKNMECFAHLSQVYDAHYKTQFVSRNLKSNPNGDLQHYLSDVATMQLIRWTEGGFGMAALNYDGGERARKI
jgi:isocitrate dehydrogenase